MGVTTFGGAGLRAAGRGPPDPGDGEGGDVNEIVPREEVSKQGVRAAGGIAGGIGLLVLAALGPVAGAIAGGLLAIVGVSQTRSKQDRRPGWVLASVGAAALVASVVPGIGGLAEVLLRLSGIGLLGFGGYSLYQFIRNLRRRM